MKLFVGTSGFAYKEWKGSFYPEKIRAEDMLRYYAERFRTVEINNTFYRMPSATVLERWAGEVPEGFAFILKASRRITHDQRLRGAEDQIRYFLETAALLKKKLGPILFQLPPNLKKDLPRLQEFLALVRRPHRAALEFRHASWYDDEVMGVLRVHEAALCVADTEEGEDAPLVATSSWGYLRLRRPSYSDSELRAWGERVRAQGWEEAFVFFKHEDEATGPRLAAQFLESFDPQAD
ncbi:MAG TPA: DUF72 domain-containing protein [Candidatus Eisenbacteria bacterium]|jgi:uncharacterized protein YecE (DUF72 family)